MQDDVELLRKLNVDLGRAETAGDREWFDGILAPKLAFQRANDSRTIVDRAEFVAAIGASPQRDTEIESIHVYGDRAVVSCVVTLKPEGKRFHNLRMFVRRGEGWKLLGWANEPV